jgi:hypothetical protein
MQLHLQLIHLGCQTSSILPQRLDVCDRPFQYFSAKSVSRRVIADGLDFEQESLEVEQQIIVMRQLGGDFAFCARSFLRPNAKLRSDGLVKLFVLYSVAVIRGFGNVEGIQNRSDTTPLWQRLHTGAPIDG